MIQDSLFIDVNYGELEERTFRQAMKGAKTPNFGNPFGSPDFLGAYGLGVCKRCGGKITFDHPRRICNYLVTKRRYSLVGYVPITGLIKKALKIAGVEMHWGTGLHTSELPDNLQRAGKKRSGPPPMQKTYYAPVWAVVLYEQSRIGALTSPKRPRVRELVDKIKRCVQDPEEQALVLTEHILGGGPYTVACQAWIGRKR